MSESGFLTIGKVTRTHGLKGELSVRSYADSPLLFEKLQRVYLQVPGKYPNKRIIQGVRQHKSFVLLRLEGIDSLSKGKDWTGALVLARKRDLPEKEEDEIFLEDLLHCKVFFADNTYLGEIAGFEGAAVQEVWIIKTPEGREVLFPVVDEFILDLDIQNSRIVIDPPAGLLDIYLQP